ncbi:MAG: universal stress protein [Gammaproteobacteria bacterium]|nr:universal stress protein [Gammaproteobacteria bacterium]
MYKTILCAIEASPEGKKVLTQASKLAELYGSELMVVSAIPYTLLPSNLQKKLKDEISPLIEKIIAPFGIPRKNCYIKIGKPYAVICKEAGRRKADLIILGTHSKKGLQSAVGSTATGVANNARCDVTLFRL